MREAVRKRVVCLLHHNSNGWEVASDSPEEFAKTVTEIAPDETCGKEHGGPDCKAWKPLDRL